MLFSRNQVMIEISRIDAKEFFSWQFFFFFVKYRNISSESSAIFNFGCSEKSLIYIVKDMGREMSIGGHISPDGSIE